MATFFGSPAIVSHPLKKPYLSSFSSQNSPPSETPQQQPQSASNSSSPPPLTVKPKPAITPDSTDWISSTLTRRFGLGAGLAWAGFLAAGVVSEQIKTRFEVFQQESNTRDVEKEEEIVLPNGIRYYDLRVGGGASPRKGDLVVIDLMGKIQGTEHVFVDTFGRNHKPLALIMGSRPYSKGVCEGIEYILQTMKAGGKRRAIIPSNLGFGENGVDLGDGEVIPPSATLEFVIEVDKVSIAPS